jgi:hypothetical protein
MIGIDTLLRFIQEKDLSRVKNALQNSQQEVN